MKTEDVITHGRRRRRVLGARITVGDYSFASMVGRTPRARYHGSKITHWRGVSIRPER